MSRQPMNLTAPAPRRLRRLAGATVAVAAALALSACISLLPKTKPAQLYRFGFSGAAATQQAGQGGGAFGVLKSPSVFQREAASDRLLTADGSEVAYVGDARWIAPAQVLFDEAVADAFAAHHGPAMLMGRGDPRHTDYALRLEVRTFEARYVNGPKAAPQVVVVVDAALARSDRTVARQKTFEVTVPAGDNRVGAIVDAYNQAMTKLLPDLTQWVDAAGPARE